MPQREEIVQQALGLPPEDRAFVAAALAHSLAVDGKEPLSDSRNRGSSATVSGDELLLELQRRSQALRAGVTTTRPATDVLADLLRRQAAETAT
jgi:hypothetical protein